MRLLFLILLLLASLSVDAAAQPSGGKYFDMPVATWLGVPYRHQIKSAYALAALNQQELCRKSISELVDCMRASGRSPVWTGATAGALYAKCSFELGMEGEQSAEKWDAQIKCIRKKVPEFTEDEFFVLGLSEGGATLVKDAGSEPVLPPRPRKILEIMDGCEKR